LVWTARALLVGSQWPQSSYPGLQRLLDQQAPEARAVDEQVALDPVAVLHDQGLDEAGLGVLLDAG
jgi:hypothetical protein